MFSSYITFHMLAWSVYVVEILIQPKRARATFSERLQCSSCLFVEGQYLIVMWKQGKNDMYRAFSVYTVNLG